MAIPLFSCKSVSLAESTLNSISGLIHDYTFDYRYHTVASYYTLLPHRSTHGDLFVKLS